MTNIPDTQATDGVPTYVGRGDPAGRFAGYYPPWMDKLASDVTLEGSLLDGAVQRAEAVRAVVGVARKPYDRQDFNFAGPWGDNSFIEDYTAEVDGRPLGAVHLVTFNAEGQAQHIAANALCDWGIPDHGQLQRVRAIDMPVFVANGDSDPMILPHFSYLLVGLIPQARVRIYPDAAHGFLFQYHADFSRDVDAFLRE